MATRPAWGGTIPLVPIGSFRDFLGHRQSGKQIKQWYIATIAKPAILAGLRTKVGRAFVQALQMQVVARFGYTPTPDAIGVELQAYLAFMRFQAIQANQKSQRERQRTIERIMKPGRFRDPRGRGINAVPEGYFREWPGAQPQPGPTGQIRRTDREGDDDQDLVNWFDRRKRRRGRLVNV